MESLVASACCWPWMVIVLPSAAVADPYWGGSNNVLSHSVINISLNTNGSGCGLWLVKFRSSHSCPSLSFSLRCI